MSDIQSNKSCQNFEDITSSNNLDTTGQNNIYDFKKKNNNYNNNLMQRIFFNHNKCNNDDDENNIDNNNKSNSYFNKDKNNRQILNMGIQNRQNTQYQYNKFNNNQKQNQSQNYAKILSSETGDSSRFQDSVLNQINPYINVSQQPQKQQNDIIKNNQKDNEQQKSDNFICQDGKIPILCINCENYLKIEEVEQHCQNNCELKYLEEKKSQKMKIRENCRLDQEQEILEIKAEIDEINRKLKFTYDQIQQNYLKWFEDEKEVFQKEIRQILNQIDKIIGNDRVSDEIGKNQNILKFILKKFQIEAKNQEKTFIAQIMIQRSIILSEEKAIKIRFLIEPLEKIQNQSNIKYKKELNQEGDIDFSDHSQTDFEIEVEDIKKLQGQLQELNLKNQREKANQQYQKYQAEIWQDLDKKQEKNQQQNKNYLEVIELKEQKQQVQNNNIKSDNNKSINNNNDNIVNDNNNYFNYKNIYNNNSNQSPQKNSRYESYDKNYNKNYQVISRIGTDFSSQKGTEYFIGGVSSYKQTSVNSLQKLSTSYGSITSYQGKIDNNNKKRFYSEAIAIKMQLDQDHPGREVLVSDLYAEVLEKGITQNYWKSFIKKRLNYAGQKENE
ncbi:hypothetical protein PPERSA_07756 [Pseudocohnilembus persalinus]|uniref:Uncharacterized protein n=1 Tax=Pseudocohnilembus persalinus TaxID=266149 RepID=A0A0V0R9Q1_PSEPJ|nr:hypothetical protein PPERSA_07756 [Pseudocohnilembus persalinus]|eukprot:KRX11231.1 hypothetical protein PPERSA_07756 [Pseudocohnilembus persalinus]